MRINAEVASNNLKMHRLKKLAFKIDEPPSVMGGPVRTFRGTDSEWDFSETELERVERDTKLQSFIKNDDVLVRPKKKQVPFPPKSLQDMKMRLYNS